MKELLEALDDVGSFASQLFDALDEAVIAIGADGHCRYANPAATSLLGPGVFTGAAPPAAHELNPVVRAETGTDYPPDDMPIARALDGTPSEADDLIIETPNGLVHVSASAWPVTEGDRVRYAVGIFRTQPGGRALDDMQNAFLQAVSHELRTPLTSLLGFAVTLERIERLSVPVAAKDRINMLETLIRKAQDMNRLLGDLLDLDRMSSGLLRAHRRPTDVRSLMLRVAEQASLGDRTVVVDAPPLLSMVDVPKVERILEILLGNVAKHTPHDARVWMKASMGADGLTIVVEDDGPGISDDMKSECFLAFRQGERVEKHSPGIGTGLSIVAGFARLHGGRCWVQDRPGGGASFHVLLPTPQRTNVAPSSLEAARPV